MRADRAIPVALLLLLASLSATAVRAHDPSLHGFSMVTFKRPFPAPNFEVDALTGGKATLSQYKGQFVLLNFWATWCPPCLEEMPSMDALYKEFSDRGFVVVAISSDSEGAGVVQGFIDKLGVSFPILLDPDASVAGVYGAKNLPVSFLINPDGNVIGATEGARDWASKAAREVIDERLPK